MPRVLWKVLGQDKILPIRCSASGREEFSHCEAHFRARNAILKGTAEYAIGLDGGTIIGRWEAVPGGGARQTEGKVYL